MAKQDGGKVVEGHMCPHGQHLWDYDGFGLVLKRTGWMSNAPAVLKRVSMRCSNEVKPQSQWHRHVPLLNGKAGPCEKYPPLLVERILRGLRDQLKETGLLASFGVGVLCEEVWPSTPDSDLTYTDTDDSEELFFDDVSGAALPPDLIRKGREEELKKTSII